MSRNDGARGVCWKSWEDNFDLSCVVKASTNKGIICESAAKDEFLLTKGHVFPISYLNTVANGIDVHACAYRSKNHNIAGGYFMPCNTIFPNHMVQRGYRGNRTVA